MEDVPPFDSNAEYLNWELARVLERLEAHVAANEEGTRVDERADVAATLRASRPAVIASRRAAVARGVAIPMEDLALRLGLRPEDEDLLMCCLGASLSSGVAKMLSFAQGSVLKPYLEVGFVAELLQLDDGLFVSTGPFDPDSPLLRHGLLTLAAPNEAAHAAGLLAQTMRAPHFVAAFVAGRRVLDHDLVAVCSLTRPTRALHDLVLGDQPAASLKRFAQALGPTARSGSRRAREPVALLVAGPGGSGKTAIAEALATSLDTQLLTVHADRLVGDKRSSERLALASKNATVLEAVLHLEIAAAIREVDPVVASAVAAIVHEHKGLTVVEVPDATRLGPEFETVFQLAFTLDRPDAEARHQLWKFALFDEGLMGTDIDLALLASQYELTGGRITSAARWARQRALARGYAASVTQADLDDGAKSQLQSALGTYTDVSTARVTMADLILPEETKRKVIELLDACRARHRVLNEWGFGRRLATGKGIVALLGGEPGTGKTLCAEILARELGVSLHMVSIPKIVSKWVGETEKNLQQVFALARAQSSMLLFDEADSLFGKRVGVEKAQDHFQNMEVNMLLQEIERFEGIIVLTTNLEANIDRAFQRRILFRIQFPVPDREGRAGIWRALTPASAPREGIIDYDRLAEAFELTGGQIKNAMLRAAYRCAAAGRGLDTAAMAWAARDQQREAGKLVKDDDEWT